jgi:Asp-tRNA(Asn)/Glu-tRNA(Gln) amidotransferase C subunit
MTRRYYKNNNKQTKKQTQKGGTIPTSKSTVLKTANPQLGIKNVDSESSIKNTENQVENVSKKMNNINEQITNINNITNQGLSPDIDPVTLEKNLKQIDAATQKLHATIDSVHQEIHTAKASVENAVEEQTHQISQLAIATAGKIASQVTQGIFAALPIISLTQTIGRLNNATNIGLDSLEEAKGKVETIDNLKKYTQKILEDFNQISEKVAILYKKMEDKAATTADKVTIPLATSVVDRVSHEESKEDNSDKPEPLQQQTGGGSIKKIKKHNKKSHSIHSRIKDSIEFFLETDKKYITPNKIGTVLQRMNNSLDEFYNIV